MRVNLTERKGVNEADRIFTSEIGWIFREQPIVDVGIDALIEKLTGGNPSGKFLAAQIKTGEGSFKIYEKELTLYVGKIHYHYWLNLCLPIILIAHFPNSKNTYWQHITEKHLVKTKKNWKLIIPKSNILNKKAESKLSEILYKTDKSGDSIVGLYNGNIEPDGLFDLLEKISCITDSADSLRIIGEVLGKLKEDLDHSTTRFDEFNRLNISGSDPRYKATLKTVAKQINIASQRIENESDIYAESISEGFSAYEKALIALFYVDSSNRGLVASIPTLEFLKSQIESAIIEFESMKNKVSRLPRNLRDARDRFVLTLESLIIEFNLSKEMIDKFLNRIMWGEK